MPAEVSEGTSTQILPLPTPAAPGEVSLDSSQAPPLPRCANCLERLAGPYCSLCGQHVADYHRSVWRFVADFFDNTFCWDNKIFRTLGPLFKQPGWLTQEFMEGRRARYVHPLRLFLFTSAICLALLQLNHSFDRSYVQVSKNKKRTVPVHRDKGDDEATDDEKPASPVAGVAPAPATVPAASVPPAHDDGQEQTESLEQVLHDTFVANLKKEKDPKKVAELAKRLEALGNDVRKVNKFNEEVATNIQQKASWVALAMLPIFAWLMRFGYRRRGGYFFSYLVFSLHYHTFLLLFWTAYLWSGTLVHASGLSWLGYPLALGFLGPPWYLYLSLRRFYDESPGRTAAKTFVIGGLHLLAIVIGVGIAGLGSSIHM